jgi:hypothetical protein
MFIYVFHPSFIAPFLKFLPSTLPSFQSFMLWYFILFFLSSFRHFTLPSFHSSVLSPSYQFIHPSVCPFLCCPAAYPTLCLHVCLPRPFASCLFIRHPPYPSLCRPVYFVYLTVSLTAYLFTFSITACLLTRLLTFSCLPLCLMLTRLSTCRLFILLCNVCMSVCFPVSLCLPCILPVSMSVSECLPVSTCLSFYSSLPA